jgi:DNA polymerase IV
MSSYFTAPEALYLDFDSFFASAEQHLRPELRGRPVGITPMPGEYTCFIAASREAKRFGLKMGTTVRDARRICPEIVVVPARPDEYVRLHHAILAVIDRVVPVGAVRSIDELVCYLLHNEQVRALELAEDIKIALAREIGPTLTCSIGLGPNELIAKIAAERDKPDGLVMIRKEELPDALYGMALQDIPGIARGNAARLMRAGVTDVRGLMGLAPKQMRALWGGVEGERMHTSLHGGMVSRPTTKRAMFGHSRILPRHWCTAGRISACARLLLVKAARRMRREGYAAQALSFSIKTRGGVRWWREAQFAAARDDQFLLDLLQGLLREAHVSGVLADTKTLYVMLSNLVPEADRPRDLFTSDDMIRRRTRWEKLSEVTDALSARFGDSAAMLGVQRQPPGGYAGAKIAFGRIPDLADFDQV